jgi:hypothetical protein
MPWRLSLPKVSSGNDTPISLMAIWTDEMPVMEPIQPVQPMLAKA